MLIEEHIFTIKTKDPQNVADIQNVATGVVISGLNVLRDKIRIGDLVFVVFGGDKPVWKTGLVGIAQVSRAPFDDGYDGKKNFRVEIDIKTYFDPIVRGDLVTYPGTFDTIGIGPITKWEPNQAITSVSKKNAIALLHAICDLRPASIDVVKSLLGVEFAEVEAEVDRFVLTKSKLGCPPQIEQKPDRINLEQEFCLWLANVYKKSDGRPISDTTSYVNCLHYLTDDSQHPGKYDEHSTSYWYNMYHYIYGVNGEPVFSFPTRAKVEEAFRGIIAAVTNGTAPAGVDTNHFNAVRAWSTEPAVKKSAWVKTSFTRYFEFLEWREAQQREKKLPELPPQNVDRLTVALKMFAEKRAVDKPSGWDSYDAWTKGVREEFSQVGESLLTKPGFDYAVYLRKYSISWQVVNTKFAPHTSAEKHAVLKFLREQKESPKSVSWYINDANRLEVGGNRVDGLSAKTLLYFMSELRPVEFAPWTEPTYEGLAFLGLHKGPAPKELTVETYEDCKAKQHQIVARMKELGIGKSSEDTTDPDYRTVNEFLWWLGQDDNKNLIKEKIMKQQWKPVNSKEKIKSGTRKLSDAFASDAMLKRLAAALRTKPFAILAGHSGTGKSQLVRRLAYMTCNNELLVKEGEGKTAPGNYCMVQVKPNWHDSTDLIGYYSEMGGRHFVNTPFVEFICKAYAYPDTPFFVCLDEMNLAPVEQYFAEYLSAIESMEKKDGEWVTDPLVEVDKTGEKDADGKEKVNPEIVDQIMQGAASTEAATWIQLHGLTIPKNLFVVGTVNMDETTCQFSRKVLDRAMTLLMNDVKFAGMANSKKPSEEKLLDDDGLKFFLEGEERGMVGETESKLLDGINEPLNNTAFVVAYRFANEYALYESAWAKLNGVDWDAASDEDKTKFAAEALDHVVLMKLLPRIHGEAKTVKGIFAGRKADGKDVPGLKSKLPSGGLSVEMMDKILARDDEYLTFWP